jgi:dTDP-4-dehydrorhamnose 3,5-epimerase
MHFEKTELNDACIIDINEITDERGFFARAWCQHEFEENGLASNLVQANISFNRHKGTLRGMHYQQPPCEEAKLIRCTKGSIFDVMVDLRPASTTYAKWIGVELTAESHRMLYVPEGFAHGYQTLQDNSEVFYQVSEFYTPNAEHGARYDDPAFGITWPLEATVISDKDASWPPYSG